MRNQSKTILITGGTGFIGQALCDHLLQEGYSLYILTRNQKLNQSTHHAKKFYIHHLSEIQNIHMDIVINLAGETIAQRWTENAKSRIYNSRISTTQDLVKLINAQEKKPELFISGSAVGYYGSNHHKTFTEEYLPEPNNAEFATLLCQDWEKAASHLNDQGIRTVLLRIGPVLGKEGGMLAKILLSFRLGLGSQIGDGQQFLSWIDRDDLVKLILFIIHEESIEGPVNATSPNPVTNKEFSFALAHALNRPCFFKTPGFVLKFIFGQMADEIMIKGQKVFPQKALSHGFQFSYPTIQQSLSKIFRE
ncbi:MAG: TIGR01777 family oxidoreductase [Alphaproteobacteria bacterium]|nr:TIGR01777 family oxidoreductase [Alphaproteobacteria bacterium]